MKQERTNEDEARKQGVRDCLGTMVIMGNLIDKLVKDALSHTKFKMETVKLTKLADEDSPEHVLHIEGGSFMAEYKDTSGRLYEITFNRSS